MKSLKFPKKSNKIPKTRSPALQTSSETSSILHQKNNNCVARNERRSRWNSMRWALMLLWWSHSDDREVDESMTFLPFGISAVYPLTLAFGRLKCYALHRFINARPPLIARIVIKCRLSNGIRIVKRKKFNCSMKHSRMNLSIISGDESVIFVVSLTD